MSLNYYELMGTPTDSLEITSNNTYDVTEKAQVVVNVPNPSTGKLTITDTASKDVTNYATAQVVDANLTSANIITGKTILGISGSAVVPSGSTTITTNTTTDVTNYASVVTNVSTNWGQIGGTLSNQSDLQTALNNKSATGHTHTKSEITDFPNIPSIPSYTAHSLIGYSGTSLSAIQIPNYKMLSYGKNSSGGLTMNSVFMDQRPMTWASSSSSTRTLPICPEGETVGITLWAGNATYTLRPQYTSGNANKYYEHHCRYFMQFSISGAGDNPGISFAYDWSNVQNFWFYTELNKPSTVAYNGQIIVDISFWDDGDTVLATVEYKRTTGLN